eukprot:COSAG01_NODE_1744_length_9355_cov_6.094327_5_plen_227_part_00
MAFRSIPRIVHCWLFRTRSSDVSSIGCTACMITRVLFEYSLSCMCTTALQPYTLSERLFAGTLRLCAWFGWACGSTELSYLACLDKTSDIFLFAAVHGDPKLSLSFYLHPSTIVLPCTAASQKFTAVNSIDLFSYCMLLAAGCWLLLPAATADCCRLQLAAVGFPSQQIIVPQIAIWLGWAQTHIPSARISSSPSQPTTSTPQQQLTPRLSPVLQLSTSATAPRAC